jgi:hypothetical protein
MSAHNQINHCVIICIRLKMKYVIKNVKDRNYIQLYNDTISVLGADEIKVVPHYYHETLF